MDDDTVAGKNPNPLKKTLTDVSLSYLGDRSTEGVEDSFFDPEVFDRIQDQLRSQERTLDNLEERFDGLEGSMVEAAENLLALQLKLLELGKAILEADDEEEAEEEGSEK